MSTFGFASALQSCRLANVPAPTMKSFFRRLCFSKLECRRDRVRDCNLDPIFDLFFQMLFVIFMCFSLLLFSVGSFFVWREIPNVCVLPSSASSLSPSPIAGDCDPLCMSIVCSFSIPVTPSRPPVAALSSRVVFCCRFCLTRQTRRVIAQECNNYTMQMLHDNCLAQFI